ncbi:MAG: hypothetical protein ACP5E3_11750 [Bacteroidales bacterium]
MKNRIVIIFLMLVLSSCGVRNYSSKYYKDTSPDLESKKWLINHIESDLHLKAQRKFTNKLINSLENVGNDSIFFIEQVRIDTLGPVLIKFDISEKKLNNLKNFSDFDYLLSTKLFIERNSSTKNMETDVDIDSIYYKTLFHIYSVTGERLIYKQELSLAYPGKKQNTEALTRKDQRRMYKSLKEAIKFLTEESKISTEK